MKVVHSNKDLPAPGDWLAMAKQHEEAGEYEEAATMYEKLVKERPHDEKVYNRLFIMYRKLKQPQKELIILNNAISAFEDLYKRKPAYNKKIVQLSKALLKSTGLSDKKGNSLYEPEPISRWKKRRKTVENLAKKQKKGV